MRVTLKAALSIVCACGLTTAEAAQLQHDRMVRGAEIHLSDLFTDVDPDQDVVLGDAPAPGGRITVGAAQLSAIAAQFGVDWTSTTGRDFRILVRDCTVVEEAVVRQKVVDALISAGIPADSAIVIDAHPPLVAESGSEIEFTSLALDRAGSGFHGALVLKVQGREAANYPISGTIEMTERVLLASHDLPSGTLLGPDDLTPASLAKSHIVGELVRDPAQAVGQVTTRSLRAGAPIRLQELHRPLLVTKGAGVIMLLTEDGLDVSAQGQAIDGGALDDQVRVLNVASHAILSGNVIGPAQVKIAPHSIPLSVASWRPYPGGPDRSMATGGVASPAIFGHAP